MTYNKKAVRKNRRAFLICKIKFEKETMCLILLCICAIMISSKA